MESLTNLNDRKQWILYESVQSNKDLINISYIEILELNSPL